MGSIRVVSKRKYGVRADGHTEHVIAIDRPSGSVLLRIPAIVIADSGEL